MSMAKDPPMDTTPVVTPARPRSPPHEPHLRLNHSKKPYLYPLVTTTMTTEYSSPSSPSPLTPPLTPAYTLQPLQALRYNNLHPRSNCSPAPISSSYHFNPTPSSSSQSGTESIFPVSDLSPPLTYLSTPRSVNESVSESTDFGAHSNYSISTDDSEEDVVFAGAEQQISPVDGNLDAIQAPSRFLFVGGVPNAATTALLKQEFAPCGELKGIYVGFQYEHGVVVLAFFDVRTATRAHELIVSSRLDDDGSESTTFFAGRKLASRFVSFSELYKLVGHSPFVSNADGRLHLSAIPSNDPYAHARRSPEAYNFSGHLDVIANAIRNALELFGGVMYFETVPVSPSVPLTFRIEFYDTRIARTVIENLRTLSIPISGVAVDFHLAIATPRHHPHSHQEHNTPIRHSHPHPYLLRSFGVDYFPHPPPSHHSYLYASGTDYAMQQQQSSTQQRTTSPPTFTRRSSTGSATFLPGELTSLQQQLSYQARQLYAAGHAVALEQESGHSSALEDQPHGCGSILSMDLELSSEPSKDGADEGSDHGGEGDDEGEDDHNSAPLSRRKSRGGIVPKTAPTTPRRDTTPLPGGGGAFEEMGRYINLRLGASGNAFGGDNHATEQTHYCPPDPYPYPFPLPSIPYSSSMTLISRNQAEYGDQQQFYLHPQGDGESRQDRASEDQWVQSRQYYEPWLLPSASSSSTPSHAPSPVSPSGMGIIIPTGGPMVSSSNFHHYLPGDEQDHRLRHLYLPHLSQCGPMIPPIRSPASPSTSLTTPLTPSISLSKPKSAGKETPFNGLTKHPRWRGTGSSTASSAPDFLVPTKRLHSRSHSNSPENTASPSSYPRVHLPHHSHFSHAIHPSYNGVHAGNGNDSSSSMPVGANDYHDSGSGLQHSSSSNLHGAAAGAVRERKATPEANLVDVERIEKGLDTRTTVMLKNVPNKMSAADLLSFIDNVCPRSLDFLYLRIDFTNHCNVGYAFVNFIEAVDLLRFCRACLGKKWNLFQSEKVLQMSYANYQGKAALVDKFRNSAVLNERPEWRPQLFHSDGPERGLPHSFPPPNSALRHERSTQTKSAGMYSQPPRVHDRERPFRG